MGYIFAAVAGAIMSLQGVINARLSEKAGLFEANTFVQGTAFALSVIVMLIFGKGKFSEIFKTEWYYWIGGILGVAITVTVMLAMKNLSPTVAVSVILISQLLIAAGIDYFGLFGTEKAEFGINKIIGLALLIGGIIVFKIK